MLGACFVEGGELIAVKSFQLLNMLTLGTNNNSFLLQFICLQNKYMYSVI